MNYKFFNNSNIKRYIFENLCHKIITLNYRFINLNYRFHVYFITSFLSTHELNELLYPLYFTNNLSFLVFIIFSIIYSPVVFLVFCNSFS